VPKEITVSRWCDPCYADGRRSVSTVTYAVSYNHGEVVTTHAGRILELCDTHQREFQALVGTGRPTGQVKDSVLTKADRLTCPLCTKVMRAQSLRNHARDVHAYEMELPTVCPECEYGPTTSIGLARHRSTAHGVGPSGDCLQHLIKIKEERDNPAPVESPAKSPAKSPVKAPTKAPMKKATRE
jgi:hypothetical protein